MPDTNQSDDLTEGTGIGPGLLVASPQMNDPFFAKTVVLLCRHEEEGAMGIVINRATDMQLKTVLKDLALDIPRAGDRGVLWGGPVEPSRGTLVFRSGLADKTTEALDIDSSIRVSGSIDVLLTLARRGEGDWALFLGYAGWGPGQLDQEIHEGSWIVLPLDAQAVFELPLEERYDHCLGSLGVDASMLFMTPINE